MQLDSPAGAAATSYSGGLKLSGRVLPYGLPPANRGVSTVGVITLRSHFLPALSFVLGAYTAADPIWLELAARGAEHPDAQRLASVRQVELELAALRSL